MIDWLKSLFRREAPRAFYCVHWVAEPIWTSSESVTLHVHGTQYRADSVDTAMAMHRSDYPHTQIVAVSYWKNP